MKFLRRLLKFIAIIGFCGLLAGGGAVALALFYLEPRLPSIDELRDVRLQVPLRVYTADKKLIAEFGEQRRTPLELPQIPKSLIEAFLAAEDDRFFEHPGVDYQGLVRAATQLLLTGERRQGGSTITMQVARNFFLTREKTYIRKLNEILLALKIEKALSKSEILTLYLNKIYLGNRAYGVAAAAEVYYGKPVSDLSVAQMAMIAGLPKAPSKANPLADPERALQRRDYVLGRMLKLGYISSDEYKEASASPVSASLHTVSAEIEAAYLAEMVRAEMLDRYGDDAYTGGYRVFTTLDSRLQSAATDALRGALDGYDQRHGYRGPEAHVELEPGGVAADWDRLLQDREPVGDLRPALVTEVGEKSARLYVGGGDSVEIPWDGLRWAGRKVSENRKEPAPKTAAGVLRVGDIVRIAPVEDKAGKEIWKLAQVPEVEGALVSLDPRDGKILALVGGYDFYRSKFNRVSQAKRQPGSSFKPFIYSAALEAGFTAATLINDAPVVFEDPSLEAAWRPENYSGKFFGPTRLRLALTKSRNLVSIRLLQQMGTEHALRHIAHFGFDPAELPHNLSLALGSGAVTPLQMAKGYAVLANGGYLVEPYFVERIEDTYSGTLYQADPLRVCRSCEEEQGSANGEPQAEVTAAARYAPREITPQNWYLMNSMMQDVIKFGTGRRARSLGRKDLAGKTGTTNDQKDAWFCGFNQSLVAVVWVGFDSAEPLGRGETGGRAALPGWISFMKEALRDIPDDPPEMPPGLVTIRIDPQTGLRASVDQQDAFFEVFRTEKAPAIREGPGQGSGSRANGSPEAFQEDPF